MGYKGVKLFAAVGNEEKSRYQKQRRFLTNFLVTSSAAVWCIAAQFVTLKSVRNKLTSPIIIIIIIIKTIIQYNFPLHSSRLFNNPHIECL
jgi:hypothetical protein